MNISEFSINPGTSLTETDLVRLASFGFEVNSLVPYAAAMVSRVLTRLAEIYPQTPKHWTRAEILGWLDDAVTEFNLISGYVNKTISLAWSQTENVLNLPSDTIAPIEVYYNSEVIKKYTVEGLDSKVKWNDGSIGLKPLAWCPLGTTKIIVYPLSQKAAQNLSIVVLYQPVPAVEAGTPIAVPPQYYDAIEHYMLGRALFKESGAEFQQADIHYNRFFEMAREWKTRTSEQRRVNWEDRIKSKSSYVRLKDQGE